MQDHQRSLPGIVEAFVLLDAVHYADSVVYVCHSKCQISSAQWDKLRGTDQLAAFATRCTGNEYTLHSWAPHHQQVYVVPPGRFLRLAIAFEPALFPGLTICCLTIFFSLCVDLKAGMSRDQFEPFRPNLVDLVYE